MAFNSGEKTELGEAIHYDQIFEILSKNIRASLIYHASKRSSWPVTGLWNRGPLKILNDEICPKWVGMIIFTVTIQEFIFEEALGNFHS